MDLLSLLRTLGGLGIVLGLLAGTLWLVRRYDIKLPGRVGGAHDRRLALVERVAVDAKRSLVLVRRDGCEHLLFLDPNGTIVVETGIPAVIPEPVEADVAASPPRSFREALARVRTPRRAAAEDSEQAGD